jgi:N-acetylglucosamine-6-sulfatase
MPTVQQELVGKGVEFRRAFVTNPLCCPSRATILTGTYSHTNGVWTNAPPGGGFASFKDTNTLPVWLHGVGYTTGLIGKYLNGYDENNTKPDYIPPGWDRWFAFWGADDYFNYEVTDQGTVRSFGAEEASYSTDVLAAQAENFIRSARSPFFLYFAPKAPHFTGGAGGDPFRVDPAPRDAGRLRGLSSWWSPSVNEADLSDKPSWLNSLPFIPQANIDGLREGQLESLLAVDQALARMLPALEDTRRLANTDIIFTSDNGYGWGEHRWAGKLAPYEEVIRVPLVIRLSLGSGAASKSRIVANVDLARTITDLAGASSPVTEGRSLVPLLRGTTVRWRKRLLLENQQRPGYAPQTYKGGVPSYCGLRMRRWKYVQYGTGEEELYDLATDPYELANLARRPALRRMIVRERGAIRTSRCRPSGFKPKTLCTINGTAGADRIRGTRWFDYVCAREGRDVIRVRDARFDIVLCGRGIDFVRADPQDRLFGCERRF